MEAHTSPNPDKAPIFIVGTGRSGTTLLRLLLNAHPNIYLTHEASFYLMLPVILGKNAAWRWFNRYVKTFMFDWIHVDEEAIRQSAPTPLSWKNVDLIFRAIMKCKAEQYGKRRYGDKTPFNSGELKKIYRDFPDARVIHIVRDPRQTVASLMRMPWAPSSIYLNSYYCHLQVKRTLPYADRIYEVTLEDLVADPEKTMRGILAYVDEPWDDAVLSHHKADISENDVPQFPWFSKAQTPIRKKPKDMSKNFMLFSPEWTAVIEQMNQLTMERFGYTPSPKSASIGKLKRFATILSETDEILISTYRMFLFAYHSNTYKYKANQTLNALINIDPKAWRHYPEFVRYEERMA